MKVQAIKDLHVWVIKHSFKLHMPKGHAIFIELLNITYSVKPLIALAFIW